MSKFYIVYFLYYVHKNAKLSATEQKMPKTTTINTAKLSQNPPPRGF